MPQDKVRGSARDLRRAVKNPESYSPKPWFRNPDAAPLDEWASAIPAR